MDTVILKLSADDVGRYPLLDLVPQFLSDLSEHQYANGYSATGKLDNMKVSVTDSQVTIQNSLTKLHFGNNIQMLGRTGIRETIEKLSDALHLPVGRAIVARFDFPRNIMLDYPVKLYLPYLGQMGRYQRLPYDRALTYRIAGREFACYDKIAQMKADREPIPDAFKGANILRIEDRHLSRIAAHFNVAEVRACTLYDEAFYLSVCRQWEQQYDKIQKQLDYKIDMSTIRTKKQFQSLGVLQLIQAQGGERAAIQDVNERFKRGLLTKKQAFDLRQEIRRCCQLEIQTCVSDLMAELNYKVRESSQNQL